MLEINDKIKLKKSCDAVRLGYIEHGKYVLITNVIERKGSNPGEDYIVYMVNDGGRINVAVYEDEIECDVYA